MQFFIVKQEIITIFAHNLLYMIMCKNSDYITLTQQYIESTFGLKVDILPLIKEKLDLLPISISGNYRFLTTNILEREVILLYSIDSTAYTPGQLQKQKELVEKKIHHPVIFIFDKMVSYNVQRLVKQRVNFIIPQKQMFIPDLLIDLKPHKDIPDNTNEHIPGIAQCIILFHLQINSLEGKSAYEIADLFNVSYANVNRAVRWLKENAVITLVGKKTKHITFSNEKRQLWETVLPLLENPIERIVYTDMSVNDNFLISGVNALSEYSMINRENRENYALSKEDFCKLQLQTDRQYGGHRIEIWRYNPNFLSTNGVVDKLSLYLSLKDTEDERIEIELENMINNITW